MRPLPKFATSSRFPSGASASPHGSFSAPICATRATSRPARSNSSTYPPVGASLPFTGAGDAYVTNTRPCATEMPNGEYEAGIFGSTKAR